MKKLDVADYAASARYIDPSAPGGVYPRSIVEGIQGGDIFTSAGSALFWHDSGFAFLYGEREEAFLERIDETFLSGGRAAPRRFILFVSDDDDKVKRYFSRKEGLTWGRRFFFEYPGGRSPGVPDLPDGYRLREIDGELLERLCGSVTPSFSWDSADRFLQSGMGYCVLDGESAAAWAFTAAVSGEEIDIGVEAGAGHRRLGLGTAAATGMLRYCLEQGKRPVWACHSRNTASQRLAQKLGFAKSAGCWTVRAEEPPEPSAGRA